MSTSQKRDADMDRLLRAALKPSPQDAADACPDADALAAFSEGGLTATEQSALDSHIAGCGRCQETLAILSHDLPQDLPEESPSPQESKWFTWVTQPRLRWLVPISAAATVAVIFFATRPLIAPEGETPGAEVTRTAQAPPALAETPQPSKRTVDTAPGAAPVAEPARDKKAAEPADQMLAARVVSEEKREAQVPAAPAPPPAAAPQPAAAPMAAAAPAEAERAVAPQDANRAVAATAAGKEAGAEKARTVPTGIAGATPSPSARALKLDAGPLVISAPGGRVLWRFGAGGRISRSNDAGSTWREQRSGVTADLRAGAAFSPTTCWIVGTSGTVLLTTDGELWVRLPFPEPVDLVAVSASGARAATVTATDGRRFDTLDAGLTWSLR